MPADRKSKRRDSRSVSFGRKDVEREGKQAETDDNDDQRIGDIFGRRRQQSKAQHRTNEQEQTDSGQPIEHDMIPRVQE